MEIKEAKKHLEEMKLELENMGGYDKSGYLPFQIDRFETAIREFEAKGKK